MPNKSYAYLLNVKPSNLVFLKTYNTAFDDTKIAFNDQNGRPLEIEDKVVWHCLLINRNDTLFCRAKSKTIRQMIWIFVICEKSF